MNVRQKWCWILSVCLSVSPTTTWFKLFSLTLLSCTTTAVVHGNELSHRSYKTRNVKEEGQQTSTHHAQNIFLRSPNIDLTTIVGNDAYLLTSTQTDNSNSIAADNHIETFVEEGVKGHNSKSPNKNKCNKSRKSKAKNGEICPPVDSRQPTQAPFLRPPSTEPTILSTITASLSPTVTTSFSPSITSSTMIVSPSYPVAPTGVPTIQVKGKGGMSKSKNKINPTPPPAVPTTVTMGMGKGKGKQSTPAPSPPQIPVYIRCQENNNTPGPTVAPILPPITTTTSPGLQQPSMIVTPTPVATITLAPIVTPPVPVPTSPVASPLIVMLAPIVSTTVTPVIALPVAIATAAPISASPIISPASGTFAPITTPTITQSIVPSLSSSFSTDNPTGTTTAQPVQMLRYDITIDFDDASVPTTDRADFIAAAQRWEEIIIGDVEDVLISDLTGSPPANPGCSYPTDTEFIDDLYMCVYYEAVPGDAIGLGGYTFARTNGIPVSGFAQIDADAIQEARELGYYTGLLLHEFGHAIGVGTAGPCPSENANSMANLEYQLLSQCTTPIPMQSSCDHYAEECLESELMTPIGEIGAHPLSRITVGWVNDIGYEVNYDAADPFDSSQLGTVAGCNCNRRILSTGTNSSDSSRNSDTAHSNSRINSNNYHDNIRYLGLEQLSMTDTSRNDDTAAAEATSTNRMIQHQPTTSSVPKLSAEGYATAMASGMAHLDSQKMKRNQYINAIRDNSTSATTSPNIIFVGDQFVWVYIRENNHLHHVLVRSSE